LQHTGTAVNLSWTPLPPIQQWRYTHFATHANTGEAADLADPDHDGSVNLIEYALTGNPHAAATGHLPRGHLRGGKLTLIFERNLTATDLNLTVQAADTPAGPWSDLASSINGTPFNALITGAEVADAGTGDTRLVEIGDIYQTGDPAHPRRLLRLRVLRSSD
jgi:hypothetical protein